MLEQSLARSRDRTAFVWMDKRLIYGEIDEMPRASEGWLQSRGLAQGACVAIMMPNVLQYPVAVCALLRAGYVDDVLKP